MNERDFEVIEFLKNQGWCLTSQIADRFYFGNRHTCSNRMRLLTRASVVERLSLSEFRNRFWHERGILNSICDLGGRAQVYRLSESTREAVGQRWVKQSDDSMLAHQVLLTRVQDRLESAFPEGVAVSENVEALRKSVSRERISYDLPDLVFKFRSLRIAVEVERKARRGLGAMNFAYESRFENLTRDYDLVLYVMERDDQIRQLAVKAEGMRRVGFCSIFGLKTVVRANRDVVSLREFIGEFEESGVS